MKGNLHLGFSTAEFLAVPAVLLVVTLVAAPTGMRARELARRSVCANNLRAVGASAMAYADDHDGRWMCPPFREETIYTNNPVDYRNDTKEIGTPATGYTPGEVGYERASESRTSAKGDGGSTALSTTRALWLLVRGGANPLDNFICPSSGDTLDPTNDIEAYYDFTTYLNVSYGYQVPFGPPSTRARIDAHPRQVFIADKGPYYFRRDYRSEYLNSQNQPLSLNSPPRDWRPYNSPNHGGFRKGEGQNLLHADGAVDFQNKAPVGIDYDNIYTLIGWDWREAPPRYGVSPHAYANVTFFPGMDAFVAGPSGESTTDSLIYP